MVKTGFLKGSHFRFLFLMPQAPNRNGRQTSGNQDDSFFPADGQKAILKKITNSQKLTKNGRPMTIRINPIFLCIIFVNFRVPINLYNQNDLLWCLINKRLEFPVAHNRSTGLERSVINYWGTSTSFRCSQPSPCVLLRFINMQVF